MKNTYYSCRGPGFCTSSSWGSDSLMDLEDTYIHVCVCMCMCTPPTHNKPFFKKIILCTRHSTHMEVRGQAVGAGSTSTTWVLETELKSSGGSKYPYLLSYRGRSWSSSLDQVCNRSFFLNEFLGNQKVHLQCASI